MDEIAMICRAAEREDSPAAKVVEAVAYAFRREISGWLPVVVSDAEMLRSLGVSETTSSGWVREEKISGRLLKVVVQRTGSAGDVVYEVQVYFAGWAARVFVRPADRREPPASTSGESTESPSCR